MFIDVFLWLSPFKSYEMKKVMKWILIVLAVLILIGIIAKFALSESEPSGVPGNKADQVAQDVLTALNHDAFKALPYIGWSFFRNKHHYKWDKRNNVAEITWDKNKVVMQLDTKEALVTQNGKQITELVYKNALINEAWKYWCNDSFWMFAPFKLFDNGVERSIVHLDNGNTGLKVHYSSGGHTPGDTYLWEINKDNIPISWKMWTNILPIDGMEVTWEKWQNLTGGAKISTFHGSSLVEMEMKNITSGNSLPELGWSNDTFKYR